MRPITLDKIASVTRNCRLAREVRAGDDYPCREGDVVVVRILTRKATYNQLELPGGRMSTLTPGDVIAGALGHRRALVGYAGRMPERLATGDEINILNLGGVLGICESESPDLGSPFRCEVLGQALHFPYTGERIGVPASIAQGLPPLDNKLEPSNIPIIAIAGTCMNAGKTQAAATIVHELGRAGMKIAAAKATGISLRRDIMAMEDAGAFTTLIFSDLGVVTTTRATAPGLTITMLNRLVRERPDAIVLELGDGLLGDYGVDAILAEPSLARAFTAVVLAANDPVGAWGGIEVLKKEHGIETTVVTGPATDNSAGTDVIARRTGVPARNARIDGPELARVILERIKSKPSH